LSQITASPGVTDDKVGMFRRAAIVASILAFTVGLWLPAASYTHRD